MPLSSALKSHAGMVTRSRTPQTLSSAPLGRGAATAVASDKVQRNCKKVRTVAKPKVQEASKAAGEAVEKGVYATGKQIGRTKGMFKNFADEFKKGMNE